MYIIFSLRSNAWMGRSVPYTSDRAKARVFSRDEAIEICRQHTLDGKLISFPVNVEDLEAVTA